MHKNAAPHGSHCSDWKRPVHSAIIKIVITRRNLIKTGLIGAGIVSSARVTNGETSAALPLISGATTLVGGQTLAGVEILTLDGPLGGVSVTGGTATPSAYNLSTIGVLSVASDGSMAGEDGRTIEYASNQGPGVITLSVDNSKAYNWTVTDYATMGAAYSAALFNLNFLASGEGQIILKDGDYAVTFDGYWKNRRMINTLTFKSENPQGARFPNPTIFNNAGNFTFDGIYFNNQISMTQSSDNLTFRNTEHFFAAVDERPGAYNAVAGPTAEAIYGNGTCGNITVENAHIHGTGGGIVCGSLVGPLTVRGCRFDNIYEDSIKLGGGQPVTIEDCYFEQPLAMQNDVNDPHADTIQFLGASGDWEDIRIARNIIIAKLTDRSNQCIFFDDIGSNFYSGVQILGNLIVNVGSLTTGIRIQQAKDCIVKGNTVVSHLGTTAFGPGIEVGGETTSGTHTVEDNAVDQINVAGPQTNVANNVILGVGGANVSYALAFKGSTFDPANRTEVLSEFAMKVGGPLDLPTNVGAISSGYEIFPSSSPSKE